MTGSSDIDNGFIWSVGEGDIPLMSGNSYYIAVKTKGVPVRVVSSDISTDVTKLAVLLYEDTGSTGGTALAIINRNRVIAPRVLPPFSVNSGVTPGTLLPQNIVAKDSIKSTNQTSSNTASFSANELLLAANKNYVLELKSQTGNGDVDIRVFIQCEQFEQ